MGNLLSTCLKKQEEEEEPQAPEDSGPQLMSQDDPAKIKLNKGTRQSVFLFNCEERRRQREREAGQRLQARKTSPPQKKVSFFEWQAAKAICTKKQAGK